MAKRTPHADGRQVVLLRGINVGGHRLSMALLRDRLEHAGCTEVLTLLQSGNVVLTPPAKRRADLSVWLAATIGDLAGYDVPVVLRTHAELVEIVDNNPYPGAGGAQLHVAFLEPAPHADVLDGIDLSSCAPERCSMIDREIYFHLPEGMGRAKLPVLVDRAVKRSSPSVMTVRNWNTVLKLVDLSASRCSTVRAGSKRGEEVMSKDDTTESKSPSQLIDEKIEDLDDWRGEMLGRLRALIRAADPEVVEEWKWRGVPVWEHDGIICTGETYKNVVKMTFAKGASLADPSGLFNSSLDGNTRRAIDVHEGEKVNERALKTLVRAAVALNQSKSKR
jgi:uncharacterized protein (DUF1697 family)